MAFMLIVRIHDRNIPKDMANRAEVDDKPENAFQGHSEVKGRMSAHFSQKTYACFLNL